MVTYALSMNNFILGRVVLKQLWSEHYLNAVLFLLIKQKNIDHIQKRMYLLWQLWIWSEYVVN